jgi:hypothetical protein
LRASESAPLRLDVDGAEHHVGALSQAELDQLRVLADSFLSGQSGVRVFAAARSIASLAGRAA